MTSVDVMYVAVTTVSSSLSVVGCCVIIGAHAAFRKLRTTGRAMLVQLSVADMLTAVGNLLGVLWYLFRDSRVLNRSMAYCVTQSAWTIFSSIASFMWTMAIAVAMCVAIVSHRPTTADRYWTLFLIVCWGLPAVVTTTALSCRVLGYDPHLHQASWCWIDSGAEHPLFWTFFTGKAWELMASLLTLTLFSAIRVSLFRHKTQNQALSSKHGKCHRDVIHDANVKLAFVPFVFIISRIWGTIRFLLGFFDFEYASSPSASWIAPLQGFGDSIQGFANFVMYCFFTRSIRKRLFRCCRGNQVHSSAIVEPNHSVPPLAIFAIHARVSPAHYATNGSGAKVKQTADSHVSCGDEIVEPSGSLHQSGNISTLPT
ncbi:G-protein coupled receptor 157-like [Babylonia areolata]|uniref:G-protein coupled receptor 157-like n=1 Tax=Babylonia areolata TaxID=304850 RepID=UPI003FD26C2F